MDLYHTTDSDGISELNPDRDKMRKLIERLDEPEFEEAEYPDVSLLHDASGWALTLYASGIVTYENMDQEDESPRFMIGVSRVEALELWQELSCGKINTLSSRPWLRDDG